MDPLYPGVLDALYSIKSITSLDFTGAQGLMDHGLLMLPRMENLQTLRLAYIPELTDATLAVVSRKGCTGTWIHLLRFQKTLT